MSILGTPSLHRAAAVTDRSALVAERDGGDGAVRWGVRVLAWTVILGCLATLAVAVLVPRIGGATPYTVLTGSMQPTLPPGALVVVRPAEQGDIHTGSVITYQLRSGEPEVVTHRVVAVRTNLLGETTYQTQGDANDVPDRQWVRPEQVRGTLWYAVPRLGRVGVLITGHQRQLLVTGVASALALYAGVMFLAAGRDRSRRRHGSEDPR